jgi:hypothetical protein
MLKDLDFFVIMFDESHNSVLQQKQLDIHVRYWDPSKNCVISRYYTSNFLGHGRAEAVLPKLMTVVLEFGINKLLQVSMDGPAVNWKLYRLMCALVNKSANNILLNIGRCGLHTVHNAFKNG